MAVSIDRVYQKVLAFANKEQRGYITPQEFNLFAHQAQMEIFEQYFYDTNDKLINQHDLISEKLYPFKTGVSIANVDASGLGFDLGSLSNFYRIGEIYNHNSQDFNNQVDWSGDWASSMENMSIVEELDQNDFITAQSGPLTRATNTRPVYWVQQNTIKFIPRPAPDGGIYNMRYIRKPINPNWGYVVVNDKALYNAGNSTDFELHESEESELVYKILTFAGIAIEKPQLTQVAAGLQGAQIQQEKQ